MGNSKIAIGAYRKSLALELQEKATFFDPGFTKTQINDKNFNTKNNLGQIFLDLPETRSEFFFLITKEVIKALSTDALYDNFDIRRFNHDGIDHSKEWKYKEYVFFFAWFSNNISSLFKAFLCLSDKRSKQLFLTLIAFRIGSHFSIRLPLSVTTKNSEIDFLKLQYFTASKLKISGMFGKLNHYDFIFNDKKYCVDCIYGLEATLHWRQYFLERNPISVKPDLGDYVIDGGACLGDTAAVFSNAVGKDGMVYSFDPLREHLDVLEKNISQFQIKNVTVMPFGIGNEDVYAEPIKTDGYDPGFSVGSSTVPLRKIDTLFKNGALHKINFIKLDIEGFEMQALLGARDAINNFKPKLAISLYHRPNDMFEIILYIKKAHPFYDFYIDHYTIHREETVLYCDPPS